MVFKSVLGGMFLALVLSACSAAPVQPTSTVPPATDAPPTFVSPTLAPERPDRLPTPTPPAPVTAPHLTSQEESELMAGFFQQIPFDGIRPVYDPQFVNAIDADLLPDDLVIGVVVGGEAKAYPVTVLRFREMVNDEIAGIPILVSW